MIDAESVIRKIEEIVKADDYQLGHLILYMETIRDQKVVGDIATMLLKLMEKYPQVDFGVSAPVFTYIEELREPDHLVKLRDSLTRNPLSPVVRAVARYARSMADPLAAEAAWQVLRELQHREGVSARVRSTVEHCLRSS